MSEPKVNERKVVRRSVAIALVAACIILVAGLGGALAYYIADKNNTISALNTELTTLQEQVIAENETIAADSFKLAEQNATIVYDSSHMSLLLSEVNNISTQVGLLEIKINLGFYKDWVENEAVSQPANSSTSWNYSADVAGLVVVHVSSSTNDTFVELSYVYNGWAKYDNTVNVGSNGSAWFPVLPANIEIQVGNTNAVDNATETVLVTYYY